MTREDRSRRDDQFARCDGPGNHYAHLDHDSVVREISPKETCSAHVLDDETLPSVEAPVGDLFGLGLGDYFQFDSVHCPSPPIKP